MRDVYIYIQYLSIVVFILLDQLLTIKEGLFREKVRCLLINVFFYASGIGIILLFINPLWQWCIAMNHWLWQDGMLIQTTSPLWSTILSGVVGFLFLDFFNYLHHRFLHSSFFLMRIHGIHHLADKLNASSTLKFQPLETIMVQLLLFTAWSIFNMPYIALLLYLFCITVFGLWNHSGSKYLHLPKNWRLIHKIINTPGVHHVHHISKAKYYNKNFAVIFTLWDVLFGTFESPVGLDFAKYQYGLPYCREADYPSFWRQFVLPFERLSYIGQKRRKARGVYFASQQQEVQ